MLFFSFFLPSFCINIGMISFMFLLFSPCLPILEIFCPILEAPADGQVDFSSSSVNSVAMYTCNSGFRLEGPDQRTCLQNGTWTDTDPTCTGKMQCSFFWFCFLAQKKLSFCINIGMISFMILEIFCPILEAPADGQIDFSSSSVNSVAMYTCNSGFRLEGPDQRTCLQNGTWTDTDPTCTGKMQCSFFWFCFLAQKKLSFCINIGMISFMILEIFCPILEAPADGQIDFSSSSVNSVAMYTCNSGFRLEGPDQRTCLQNGTWTDTDPTCTGKIQCFFLLFFFWQKKKLSFCINIGMIYFNLFLFLSMFTHTRNILPCSWSPS